MPRTTIVIAVGLTVTVDTTGSGGGGSATVSVAVPDTLSAVALIIVSPAPTPVARPSESTVATISSELDHVNSTSGISVPSDVDAFAANCFVPPTSIVSSGGLTVTPATTGSGGGGSVTLIVTGALDMLLPVARTVAVPAATAVATPLLLMVTTAVLLLDHVKLTPLITVPSEALAVAVNRWVFATSSVAAFGLTSTTETVGAGGGVGVGVVGSVGLVGEESPPPHPTYRNALETAIVMRPVAIDLNDIRPPDLTMGESRIVVPHLATKYSDSLQMSHST